MRRLAAEQTQNAFDAFALWIPIAEMDDRYLRVVLLPDRKSIHNAFFDRSFRP